MPCLSFSLYREGVWVFDDAPAGLLEGGSSAGPSPNDSGGVAWKGLTEKMILRLNQLSAFDDPTVYDQFCTSNRLTIDLKLRVGDWNARSIELLLTFLVLVAEEVI